MFGQVSPIKNSSENMISKTSLLLDSLFFIKNDLINNITDPMAGKRPSNSKFVLTSYPQRGVFYPLITIKAINIERTRAGMQTTAEDILLKFELRIWARNEKEKDDLYSNTINRLNSIQFTSSTGSVTNGLHDYNSGSAVEIDEEGEGNQVIKSRIIGINYKFYG